MPQIQRKAIRNRRRLRKSVTLRTTPASSRLHKNRGMVIVGTSWLEFRSVEGFGVEAIGIDVFGVEVRCVDGSGVEVGCVDGSVRAVVAGCGTEGG